MMSGFENKITKFLSRAREQDIIDAVTEKQLATFFAEQNQHQNGLSLAKVLSWIGGFTLLLGLILIISANWDEISNFNKLAGFIVLLIGTHGCGIYARQQLNLQIIGDGLNFVGAGLFLGGIALVSQIFQLDGKLSTMFLIWFLGIAPLAWAFHSISISFLSIFGLLTFIHIDHAEYLVTRSSFLPSIFIVDVGLGVGLLGASALIRVKEPNVAVSFRGSGVILLFCSVYVLGFLRHMNGFGDAASEGLVHPFIALFFGGIALGLGQRQMLPENPILKKKLVTLLGALLVVCTIMLLAAIKIIPPGPDLKVFDFGWYRTFFLIEWLLSLLLWFLWFGLALWCVFFASATGRKAYLNVGVLAVGFGVITRFFDLMGGLLETGLAFVIGGLVLLATCFFVEKWRRNVSKKMRQEELAV